MAARESWRRNLYVLWAIEFAAFTGLSLILPFIPLYVRQLGITDEADVTRWSGLVLSAPFMVSFLATPIWGALGDRHGQKLMVVRALFGSSICYIGAALSTSVVSLFMWRLALGSVSGFLAAGMALMSVTAPDEHRGYALGLLQSVIPASGLLGPLLGGALADLIGYRAIFFVVAALTAVGGLVAALTLIEPRQHGSPVVAHVRVRDNITLAWQRPDLRQALLALGASQMLVTMLQPVFVLFVERLGVEGRLLSTTTGALFAATGITALIAAPWWGRRGDRRGFHGALTVALLGSALLLFLQGMVTGVAQLFVLRLAYGAFVAGILPALLGVITAGSPAERRGAMMGLSSSAIMIGNLLGPISGGFVAAHAGLRAVFFVSATLLLLLNGFARRLRS
ncbi:MAG: MFS transporter [Deltaproteobacteria bacterium]|nr:MFS transporter [Deltaproteobacteria bacterium]MBI3387952.1 MFS transporter [Deltaproteobacteria bacterium]